MRELYDKEIKLSFNTIKKRLIEWNVLEIKPKKNK